jgi:hypothetical protein
MTMTHDAADEARARRAAKRVGLQARKGGRWRANTIDNRGGFMITDQRNVIIAGERFDLTAKDVVEFCEQSG